MSKLNTRNLGDGWAVTDGLTGLVHAGTDEQRTNQESTMMTIEQAIAHFENHDFTGVVDVPEVKVAKVTPSQLIEQYGCGKDTNRAKMLTCLGRNFGKQVTRAKLLTAVYGDDDLKNKGGLAMLLTLVKDRDLPYVIVKRNTTIGLYPVAVAASVN